MNRTGDFKVCKIAVPESYRKDFQNLINNERNAILYEIDCIIDKHREGTNKEDDARAYESVLRNISKSIE